MKGKQVKENLWKAKTSFHFTVLFGMRYAIEILCGLWNKTSEKYHQTFIIKFNIINWLAVGVSKMCDFIYSTRFFYDECQWSSWPFEKNNQDCIFKDIYKCCFLFTITLLLIKSHLWKYSSSLVIDFHIIMRSISRQKCVNILFKKKKYNFINGEKYFRLFNDKCGTSIMLLTFSIKYID